MWIVVQCDEVENDQGIDMVGDYIAVTFEQRKKHPAEKYMARRANVLK